MSKLVCSMRAVLDRAFADRTMPTARRRTSRNLPLDLRRIDGVARIGRRDDAVDFDLAVVDRDFCARRDVAAVAHELRKAAELTGLAPACPSRYARPRR